MTESDRVLKISQERAQIFAEMTEEVRVINSEKGWYDSERSFGEMIALLHSEVSEMLEAFRDWDLKDSTKQECEVCSGECSCPHLCKPQGVASEMADVLIRLLDMSSRYNVDLAAEYERKIAYNCTRPYRHGGRTL